LRGLGFLLIGDAGLLFDQLADTIDVERLGDDVVETLALLAVRKQAFDVGGDDDEPRQLETVRILPQGHGDVEPAHLRQVEIEKRHVVLFRLQCLQGFAAVGRNVDLMPALGEKQFQQLVRNRAVFRDQDPASGRDSARRLYGFGNGGGHVVQFLP
jgi:hypothetical protein